MPYMCVCVWDFPLQNIQIAAKISIGYNAQ